MPNENEVRSQIHASIQTIGLAATAKRLDLHAEVVARVACGARVRAGTLALAGQRLGLLVASSPQPMLVSTAPAAGDIAS